MIRRIRAWLAPRTHRVIAGDRGAIWDCRLCPATGWEAAYPSCCKSFGGVARDCLVCLGRGCTTAQEIS